LEEAERIKQLGYDREREEREEKARKEAEALENATRLKSQSNEIGYKKNTTSSSSAAANPIVAPFARLGFGALPSANTAAVAPPPRAPVEDDAPTTAREKYGNQKAISSDMYFGRGTYDPSAVSEAQTRLQNFSGATSISSDAYFGRTREEEEDTSYMGSGGGNYISNGDSSLANLESAARETLQRVLSNPDVQNVGETIRSGALKLSDYLASMSER